MATNGRTDKCNGLHASGPNGVDHSTPGDGHPLAVCGIGVRLPGGIRNTSDFWELLINGRDAIAPVPETRYNVDAFSDSLGGKEVVKSKCGYFLDEDLSRLDTSLASMTRQEVERCDPQQRQLLEVTKEALDDAGEMDYRGRPVGCFVGAYTDDWLHMTAKETQHKGGYILTGSQDYMLANRLSYEHDLKGPSMTIKTACSAALIAFHEACRSIQNGDATSALVATSSLILTTVVTAAFGLDGIISPDASCKTFDAKADGFGRAEAVSAIYIKRLSAALRDGNPIRAVTRATGTNSDGKGHGLTNPTADSQAALIRKVYQDAGLDPGQTAYVECHGTGTAIGDVVETTAVGSIFGERGVYIGSVKPNVGHGEGASGLNSLIKAVLALENRIIPPNIKFEQPNPKIPFIAKGLRVPVRPTAFPKDRVERISVNSFGLGGTNAHVIVESYRGNGSHGERPRLHPELFLFSAHTELSLKGQMARYRQFLQSDHLNHRNIAYTLATRREKLPFRGYTIFDQAKFTEASSLVKAPTYPPNLYLIFTGQGAQWPGMGKELMESDALFKADMERMDKTLQKLDPAPDWSLQDEFLKAPEQSRFGVAEVSQPVCTALQVALFNKLARARIEPTAVVGHSSGEIAGAYAAGDISMEAAIVIAYCRGYVIRSNKGQGAMAAVGLGPHDVSKFIVKGVRVACENSPTSTTLSGDRRGILDVVSRIQSELPDVPVKLLNVNTAYHSHLMAEFADEYEQLLNKGLATLGDWGHEATSLFVSSLTGSALSPNHTFGPKYWAQNVVSPVRFSAALSKLLELKGGGTMLEVGPHSTLAGPLRQICAEAGQPFSYASALVRGESSTTSILSAFGRLFQEAVPFELASLYPTSAKVVSGLPAYHWDHSDSFWYESRLARDWRQRRYPHHCLLGSRTLESPDTEPQWRNILSLDQETWLAGHKVDKDVVFPLACYIAMAGEALRQTKGCETGYSIRHTVARAAMVLTDSRDAEIITSLRPHRLTDYEGSGWFEFAISSYNGASWTKHIQGQIRPLERVPCSTLEQEKLPRKVDASRLYEALAAQGINLGPEFQRLECISASVSTSLASADIAAPSTDGRRAFTMHPLAIDACIQLFIVAQAKGLCRNITQLVPVQVESLDVLRHSGDGMTALAWGSVADEREVIEAVSDGKLALRLSGLKLASVQGNNPAENDVHAAARLEWLPDWDFIKPSQLIKAPPSNHEHGRVLEEMALLCILDSAERLEKLSPARPHLAKLRRWLQHVVLEAKSPLVPDFAGYFGTSREERKAMIANRHEALLGTEKDALALGLKLVCDGCERIFRGEEETLDILMTDGVLTKIYDAVSFGYGDFVHAMSRTKPTLRILEVGAGTGGTTELILRDMLHEGGLPQYSAYTFTDVSAGFFPQAKERFAYAPNMQYKVFDITRDPVEQDFTIATYDLVIAANVVHATPSLQQSLRNINKLLKPGGTLLLSELCTQLRSPGYVFGHFEGWWLGENDGRPNEPFVDPSRWHDELLASGFTGLDDVVYDDEVPYTLSTTIISKRTEEERPLEKAVSLVTADAQGEVATSLVETLQQMEFTTALFEMGDELPAGHDVVVCVDLEKSFFDNMGEEGFRKFQSMVRCLGTSQNLLWLTSPAQIECYNPRAAQSIGVARTIRSELGLRYYTLEIDKSEAEFAELVLRVMLKIRREDDDANLASDREFAVDKGHVCVGRYHPFSLPEELARLSAPVHATYVALESGDASALETLRWVSKEIPQLLPPHAVEMELKSVGLNFRDVLMASGAYKPTGSTPRALGLDASGVISAVGSNVWGLKCGDKVFGLTPYGCFSTKAVVNSQLVAKMPDGMGFDEAATIPAVFYTAIKTLLDIGNLKGGQRVLIHSACGGLGMAAIQVCQMVGADIYATVGSDDKVNHLVDNYAIPRARIFSSRDESFVDGIMKATGNHGIDVVLNSLSGDLLHASWNCVAEFGIMVEVGKRDLLGRGKLDMGPFLGNRQYACFDGLESARKRPEQVAKTLNRFLDEYQKGRLRPIPTVSCFEAKHVVAAFRHLQNGSHLGKVVVSMARGLAEIEAKPLAKPIEFDSKATYLLVGGLGGLGRSMATWLVEHGARALTFLSRSAGTSEASKATLAELERMGCNVTMVAGAAENMDHVQRAIDASTAPIKGVFHLAMVLQDSPMVDMTWEQWDAVAGPKVKGAWNLHRAFMEHSLDFFWIASSLVSVIGHPGQGNYAASSSFLEAFCQFRMRLGLPTAVLNICPIRGVGYIAESAAARRNMKVQGAYYLGEKEYLDFVELTVRAATRGAAPRDTYCNAPLTAWKNTSQVLMGLRSESHLEDPTNRCSWRHDRRMGSYHNISGEMHGESGSSSVLKSFLNDVSDDTAILDYEASIRLLAREIGARVYDLLLKPSDDVDIDLTLSDMGLDSLMAIELRRWFQQVVGIKVSVLEMMSAGSLAQLSEVAAARLKTKYG